MMRRFFKRHWFAVGYGVLLAAASALVLLDTFVIPRAERAAVSAPFGQAETMQANNEDNAASQAQEPEAAARQADALTTAVAPEISESSYRDEHIQITIETVRSNNTTCYIADVRLSDPSYLRAAFAKDTYGRNIRETTSAIAERMKAILAINGDYYGFRNSGYVVRNGVLYRQTPNDNDLLLIDRQGDLAAMTHAMLSPADLATGKWWQVFSFGPTLVLDGETVVTEDAEVGKAKTSNPRTAIGQIEALHYAFVVSDGRTDESDGLSLYQLSELMQELGCQTAYNLDGGGSSTMVFMGKVVNRPTANGGRITEREVSDIVCIGY